MNKCICGHTSYWSEFADGKMTHCFGCHTSFPSTGQGALSPGSMVIDRPSENSEPFVLPLESRPLHTTDWLERWPNVTPELAKKYNWYVSEINGYEYLVMPITRNGRSIFYSARALDHHAPKKYHYHAGVKRDYWLSDDTLARQPVFICEGVADAVSLSPYGSSVGLLGGHYDGRLDDVLKDKKVIVAFDGDFQGYCLAVKAASAISGHCRTVRTSCIQGKDPTEWSMNEIEEAIQ